MHASQVEHASHVVKRQARYEWELDHLILESVFSAGSAGQLKDLVQHTVFNDPKYGKLPKYRQIALEAYFRGAMDALARVSGAPRAPAVAALGLKTAPRKAAKKRTKVDPQPQLYPSQGIRTPVPEYFRPISVPPPEHPQPWPFASDLGVASYG